MRFLNSIDFNTLFVSQFALIFCIWLDVYPINKCLNTLNQWVIIEIIWKKSIYKLKVFLNIINESLMM